MNEELQAEDMAALAAEAAKVDAENNPAPVAENPEATPAEGQPEDHAADVSALVSLAVGLLSPMFPSLALIYTPTVVKSIGDAAAPVMVKRGWSAGGLAGQYEEEITLALVVVPLGWATYEAISTDINAKKDTPPEGQVGMPAEVQPVAPVAPVGPEMQPRA